MSDDEQVDEPRKKRRIVPTRRDIWGETAGEIAVDEEAASHWDIRAWQSSPRGL